MIHNLVRLALAAIVIGVLAAAWTSYRMWDVGHRDDRQAADAIVVLGAAQYNGRPSAILKSRLDHGIELYQAGVARYLVMTGGKAEGDITTEAASARTYAVQHGVPAAAILAEDQGRTTAESLKGVAELMREHGLTSAVFVSDRSHMLRVLLIARDQGITGHGSPTTTSPSDASPLDWVIAGGHELGGLAVYFVTGEPT